MYKQSVQFQSCEQGSQGAQSVKLPGQNIPVLLLITFNVLLFPGYAPEGGSGP